MTHEFVFRLASLFDQAFSPSRFTDLLILSRDHRIEG